MIIKSEKDPEFDGGQFFCYYNEDNQLVGEFMIFQDEIWDVEIFEQFRNHGFGKTMFWEFFEQVADRKEYLLWVVKENEPAKKLYEKLGFFYVENKYEEEYDNCYQMKIIL